MATPWAEEFDKPAGYVLSALRVTELHYEVFGGVMDGWYMRYTPAIRRGTVCLCLRLLLHYGYRHRHRHVPRIMRYTCVKILVRKQSQSHLCVRCIDGQRGGRDRDEQRQRSQEQRRRGIEVEEHPGLVGMGLWRSNSII